MRAHRRHARLPVPDPRRRPGRDPRAVAAQRVARPRHRRDPAARPRHPRRGARAARGGVRAARRSPTAPATATILGRHMLPNMASALLVQATVAIPAAIIGEAVLSFLGLGVQPPTPSWGVDAHAAQPFLDRRRGWRLARPGDLARHARRSTCSATACATSSTRGRSDDADAPARASRDLTVALRHRRRPRARGRRRVASTLGTGEILAIVGESGCGKSVTAMSLLGLLPATAHGRAARRRFDGARAARRVASASCARIRGREVSVVFQEPMTSLNPVFTVGRQIAEVLRRHLGTVAAPRRATRTIELLELVGIPSARAARRRVPAPALGRHAPARDDRDGARVRAAGADRRRADDRARRDDPGRRCSTSCATCASGSAWRSC